VVIGRKGRDGARRVLGPVDAGTAATTLAGLVALGDRGLSRPLPLPIRTAHQYAEAVGRGSNHQNALRSAATAWRSRDGGEAREAANALVWGPEAELDDLVAAGLAGFATQLWEPLQRAGARQ
jgi:exodeoxyribonuclease V gamma subunit